MFFWFPTCGFPLDRWENIGYLYGLNMANPPFVNGAFYHIYNRGVEKRTIFLEQSDYIRFLETVNYYRNTPLAMKLSDYKRGKNQTKKVENQVNLVNIFAYCLMPNHYHLLISQNVEGGITQFLKKLSDSYTRYFNTRNNRVGPLFQGSFKAKLITNDEYLLQLSKYIHRNSFPLSKWERNAYPYSSYRYYLSGQKHPFCDIDLICAYFSKTNPYLSYQNFVEETPDSNPILYDLTIDSQECFPTFQVG